MSARNGACDRAGCSRPAFGRVSVLVFSAGDLKRTRGARLWTALLVCSTCARRLSPRDVISDAGWEEVCRSFLAEGRVPPRREAAQVLVQPVVGPARRPWPSGLTPAGSRARPGP